MPFHGADRSIVLSEAGMTTDEKLMTAVAAGDRGVFDILVRRYQDIVWRIARRYTGNDEDARDICQTVFLNIYTAGSRYKIAASFKTYLYRIVNNACIDYYRKKRPETGRDPETIDPAPLQDEILEKKERSGKVRRALAQLPDRQRAATVLRYEGDLPIKEIAAVMAVSEKAVERLLARAREALRGQV
jgi:RNA polymerase sigma-70 factor, ECF subfamily